MAARQSQTQSLELSESVIRRVTRLAAKYNAINLGQGFPDARPRANMVVKAVTGIISGAPADAARLGSTCIDAANVAGGSSVLPDEVNACKSEGKTIADLIRGIVPADADALNQYSAPFGTTSLRSAIQAYYKRIYDCSVNTDDITVTLGATEAVSVTIRSIVGPGNAVVVLAPYHEMYVNQAKVFGAYPLLVPMEEQRPLGLVTNLTASESWKLDFDRLEEVIEASPAPVKALIVNDPHNPTGKVFTDEELKRLVEICLKRGLKIITDEIYEHIIFGRRFAGQTPPHHRFLWNWGQEVRDATIIINSISKTGSATGWRVGWILSPSALTENIRAIHDNVSMQAPTPLQFGAEALLTDDLEYFHQTLPRDYERKLAILNGTLREVGFDFSEPEGAYYIFANYNGIKALAGLNADEASNLLTRVVGVAGVPGTAFLGAGLYPDRNDTKAKYIRFAFCKSDATLREACARLQRWKANGFPTSKCTKDA